MIERHDFIFNRYVVKGLVAVESIVLLGSLVENNNKSIQLQHQ